MPRTAKATATKPKETKQIVCFCCGHPYDGYRSNFSKFPSPAYRGNGGYCHVCTRCIVKRFTEWTEKYKDEMKAVRRVCEWLDLYYSPDIYELAKKEHGAGTTLIQNYFRKCNLAQFTGVCFDDTLEDERKMIQSGMMGDYDSKEALELFGEGFDAPAYQMMLKSYHSYIDPLGKTATAGQHKEARFLAVLEYRTLEAIKSGSGNASQLSNSFRGALKDSGFDVATRQGETVEEPFGVWIKQIENLAPAEYVRDNEIYKDEDKMGYFERFLARPLTNLLRGLGYVRDEELSIKDEDLDAGAVDSD